MLEFEAPVTPNTDTYENEIQSEIRFIENQRITDYDVVKGYRDFQGRYEAAIMSACGSEEPIKEYYIKKEAFRHVANARGYINNVLKERMK